MNAILTLLGILCATAALLAGLFAIGAARQSSYLSRQEEERDARYREGGWNDL